MKFVKLIAIFSLFLSFAVQAQFESNRIWRELDQGGQNVVASKSIELFVLRAGYGNYVISGFDKYDPFKKKDTYDEVLVDSKDGIWLGAMCFGLLYDGQAIFNGRDTYIRINAIDHNGDGKMDTKISIDSDSVIILGIKPNEIYGWQLYGG